MTQAPDYFALLDIEPAFNLDDKLLEDAYFAAQRQYHPDRFVGKTDQERAQALQTSVDINQGYQRLKQPYTRAKYLLQCHHIDIDTEQGGHKPSATLLMDIMEWRETIDDATTEDTLQTLANTLEELKSDCISRISQAYQTQDFTHMADQTIRLGYLIKSTEELRQKRKRLTA